MLQNQYSQCPNFVGNKIYKGSVIKMYKCPACGKEFETLQEVAKCMNKDLVEEEKKKEKDELKKKEDRTKELEKKASGLSDAIEKGYDNLRIACEEYGKVVDELASYGVKDYPLYSVLLKTNKSSEKTYKVADKNLPTGSDVFNATLTDFEKKYLRTLLDLFYF